MSKFVSNVTRTFEKPVDEKLLKAIHVRNLNDRIDQAQIIPLPVGVIDQYRDDVTHPDIRNNTTNNASILDQRDQLYMDVHQRQSDDIKVTINETRAPGTAGLNAIEVANGMPIRVMSGQGLLVSLRHQYKIHGDPSVEHELGNIHKYGEAQDKKMEYYFTHQRTVDHLRHANGTTKALGKDYNINRLNNRRLAVLSDTDHAKTVFERRDPIQQLSKAFPLAGKIVHDIPHILNLNKYAHL